MEFGYELFKLIDTFFLKDPNVIINIDWYDKRCWYNWKV